MTKRLLTLALAALSAASVSAQSPDPVISRIFRLGMDSSRLEPLAQVLLDSVGPRLTGTDGMASASDWVMQTYRSWGIDARRHQYGTWRGWRRGVSHIDLMEPRVRSLEGMMLAYSPGTRGRNLTAEAIILPQFADSNEFVKWLPQAKGKIVLLSPAWPTCRPSEDWIRTATPASRAAMDTAVALMQRAWRVDPDSSKRYRGTGYALSLGTGTLGTRLEKAGVVGMITSRPKLSGFRNPFPTAGGQGGGGGGGGFGGGPSGPASARGGGPGNREVQVTSTGFGGGGTGGSGGWGTFEIFETYNTAAPAIGMSCEDYGLLFRLAENGDRPTVRMNLDAEL